jgi:predicted amidohydrolase
MPPWRAALFHVPTFSVAHAADAPEASQLRVERIADLHVRVGRALAAEPADLVLLPEFAVAHCEDSLIGVAQGDGPEIDRLSAMAQDLGVILGAMLYVTDARFPGRYFNASLLFDSSGDVLARYYRLITNHASSPHDFWQRYLDVIGLEGAFPVARTRLGNFALMSSMEIMYPELARTYMVRGAEVLLHLTAYSSDNLAYMNRARSHENMMYLLSASATAEAPTPGMIAMAAADWRGRLIGAPSASEPHLTRATIDVQALRTARATPLHPDYLNLISRLRTEAMRVHYDDLTIFPPDRHVEGDVHHTKITPETQPEGIAEAIANMRRAGIVPELE